MPGPTWCGRRIGRPHHANHLNDIRPGASSLWRMAKQYNSMDLSVVCSYCDRIPGMQSRCPIPARPYILQQGPTTGPCWARMKRRAALTAPAAAHHPDPHRLHGTGANSSISSTTRYDADFADRTSRRNRPSGHPGVRRGSSEIDAPISGHGSRRDAMPERCDRTGCTCPCSCRASFARFRRCR